MQGFCRIAVIACAVMALSACSTFRLITFNAHEQSKPVPDSTVTVSAQWVCPPAEGALPGYTQMALATLAYNLLSSEVIGWAEGKKARFTQTYGALVNVPAKSSTCGANAPLQITVSRSAGAERLLARLAFVVEPFDTDNAAWQMRAQSIDFRNAAALTSQKSARVDITTTIAISTVTPNEKNAPTFTRLTEQSLNLPRVQLPSSGSVRNPPVSPLFPKLPDNRPLTIAVAVTETGSGGEDFGQLAKHIAANSDLIRSYLKNVIED